jgi:hypothetical protein
MLCPGLPGHKFLRLRMLRFRNPWQNVIVMVYIYVFTLQRIRTGTPFHANVENTGTLSPAFAALPKTLQNCRKIVQITSWLAILTKNASATPLLATHFQNKGAPTRRRPHTSHITPPAHLAVLWHNNLLVDRLGGRHDS